MLSLITWSRRMRNNRKFLFVLLIFFFLVGKRIKKNLTWSEFDTYLLRHWMLHSSPLPLSHQPPASSFSSCASLLICSDVAHKASRRCYHKAMLFFAVIFLNNILLHYLPPHLSSLHQRPFFLLLLLLFYCFLLQVSFAIFHLFFFFLSFFCTPCGKFLSI